MLIPISRNGLLLARAQHKIHKNTRILLLKKIRQATERAYEISSAYHQKIAPFGII